MPRRLAVVKSGWVSGIVEEDRDTTQVQESDFSGIRSKSPTPRMLVESFFRASRDDGRLDATQVVVVG